MERDIENVSDSVVMKLFENIDELAQSGWREENIGYVCDGCSYELQVTYLDGQFKIQTLTLILLAKNKKKLILANRNSIISTYC